MTEHSLNPEIEPVHAEIHGVGQYKTLLRVGDLAEALLNFFPEEGRGEDYETALMACLDCMEGGDTFPSEVREAFVAAARECGITVLPDDAPNIELDF